MIFSQIATFNKLLVSFKKLRVFEAMILGVNYETISIDHEMANQQVH